MNQSQATTTQLLSNKWLRILLKEDSGLVGQEYQNQKWTPLTELQNPITRSICANEFVFDIDAKDWNSCYQLAKNLEEVLDSLEIPFLRFTTGNFMHYHLFFDKKVSVPNVIWKDYFRNREVISIDDLKRFLKQLRYAIFEYLCETVNPVKNAHFDMPVMSASRHLIRMVGGENKKTGYYKSLLDKLPKRQPKTEKQNVVFPEKIEYWYIPEELLFYVYQMNIQKPRTNRRRKLKFGHNNISWIEDFILKKTFTDGRKRLIDLVLLPFLLTVKGKPIDEAIGIVYDWALKNHEISPIKINGRVVSVESLLNYIRYKAKRIEKNNLLPLSRDNLDKWFNDMPEIKEVK